MTNFFTYPMRIFYLSFCIITALSCVIFYLNTDYITLHQILFLDIIFPCAYAGFLFTALPSWSGHKSELFIHSTILFSFVVLGLLSLIFRYKISAIFMLFYWAYMLGLAIFMGYKTSKVYSLIGVVFGFFILQIAYAFTGDISYFKIFTHFNSLAIAIVAFRVGTNITNFALKDIKGAIFLPNEAFKNLQVFTLLLLILSLIFMGENSVSNYLSLGVGFIFLARLNEFFYKEILRKDFSVFYCLVNFMLGGGYILYGLGFDAFHLIAICGILATIMLIFIISGLNHNSQEFRLNKFHHFMIILIFLAGFIRVSKINGYIHIASLLLIVAFLLYAVKFYKIFRDSKFS